MKFFNRILKWIAVLAFSLSAGLLTIILLSDKPQISPFLIRILILLSIGFFSGFFMRLLFRKGYRVIQAFFSLLTSVLSVLIIDYFYKTEYMLSFITKGFNFQIPSASDGAQIGLMLLISLPMILLFRKKKAKKTAESTVTKSPRLSFSDRIKPVVYQANPKNWNIHLPEFNISSKTKDIPPNIKKSAASSVHISNSSQKKAIKKTTLKSTKRKTASNKKIRLPGKRSHHINNDVKLMGEEEHVCPYCLEEVVKNDSRGVVVCPECNTWHHKDCWDITGGCGVAHRNQL